MNDLSHKGYNVIRPNLGSSFIRMIEYKPFLVITTLTLVLAAVTIGTVYLSKYTLRTIISLSSLSTGLVVQEVRLRGRHYVDLQTIKKTIKVKSHSPILLVNLAAVKSRLENVGWIKNAEVRRDLPSTIEVNIVERKPFALWQYNQSFALISRDGSVITRENLNRFANYPLVIGIDAPLHAAALRDILGLEPALLERVNAATRVGKRRWNLMMDGRIDVLMPEKDLAVAWHRLAELQKRKQLLERKIRSIDLRFHDRLIIHLMPGVAEQIDYRGKAT